MKIFTLFALTFAFCFNAQAQVSKKVATSFTTVKESFETGDNGWTIIDYANKMASGTVFGVSPNPTAFDGEKYLLSRFDSSSPRDAWAISPASNLTAGNTYAVSLYVYGKGYNNIADEFTVTVGKGNTIADQTTILIDKKGTQAAIYNSWTKVTANFTPEETGAYNFGINHCTSQIYLNIICFDLFEVKEVATDGVNDLASEKEILSTQYFNLSGMPVQEITEKGIYVKRITYTDGSVKAVKFVK